MNKVEMTLREVYDSVLLDIYNNKDDFTELSTYADKLTRYLRECLE